MTSNYISKGELAQMYAPNLSPHSAVNRLMLWLKKDSDTMQALREAGYSPHQKVFSPRQVEIIISYLGEP